MNREGEGIGRGPDPFAPGTLLLGRYEYVRVLGRGAMGEVLDVRDRRTGQRYALKRIPPELVRNSSQMQAVQTNFNLVQGLTHPHIAVTRFLEADDATGQVYILMDLVRGRDLQTWLEERRYSQSDPAAPLPLSIALGICEQAASALDYAHAKPIYGSDGKISRHGILHRDLKPANIMVVDDQQYRPGVPYILLVDFGLAAEIQASLLSSTVHVDGGNLLAGSPLYMAPEQWSGRTLTRAIDQWALAVMLYEMVEGGPPFPGPTRDELRAQAMFQPPLPPEVLSPAQWAALKTALEKDRTKRHPNCMALVQAVAAADPTPGPIPPASAVTPGSYAGAGSSGGSGAGSGSSGSGSGGAKDKPLPPTAGKGKDDTTGRWPAVDATTLPGSSAVPPTGGAPPPSRSPGPLPPRPRKKGRRLLGISVAAGTALLLAGLAVFWPTEPRPIDPDFGSRIFVQENAAALDSGFATTGDRGLRLPPPDSGLAGTGPAGTGPADTATPRRPSPWEGSIEPSPLVPPAPAAPSATTGTAMFSPTRLLVPWAPPLGSPATTSKIAPFPPSGISLPPTLRSTLPPTITQIPVQNVEESEVLRFKVAARDAEGGTTGLRFKLLEGPKLNAEPVLDGKLDPDSGDFSWTAPPPPALRAHGAGPKLHRASFQVSAGEGGAAATSHVFIRVWPTGRLHWPMDGGPWRDGASDAEDLPTHWGPGKNIVWKIERPDGVGKWSSPVIWGDEIWMATRTTEKWTALCLSKATGAVLRQFDVLASSAPAESMIFATFHPPAMERGRLYFHLGKDGAFCLDSADGRILWSNRQTAAPDLKQATAPPQLVGDRLLLPFEGPRGPVVVALDPKTGKEAWRQSLELTNLEGKEAKWPFFRPLVGTFDGERQVVLYAGGTDLFNQGGVGGTIAGYDLATGAQAWRMEVPKIRRLAAMYSMYKDRIAVVGWNDVPPDDGAFKLPDHSGGLYTSIVDEPGALRLQSQTPTAKNYPDLNDYLTLANSRGTLCVGGKQAIGVDLYSGNTIWSWPLEGATVGATFIAGQKVYFFTNDNRCGVIDLKTGEILAVNSFDKEIWFFPTILASERSLFLHTSAHFYRIEEPPPP